jgi:hypothetical protein
MIKENVKEALKCNACGKITNDWHEVYYEDFSKLKKAEKTYISWCKKVKGYVIVNASI